MSQWRVDYWEAGAHVTPVDDLKPHTLTERCWCNPTEDFEAPGLYTHHSMDCRESYENGRKVN